MTTCPICSQPMSRTHPSNGKIRTYCSRLCQHRGNSAAIAARDIYVDEVVVERLLNGVPVVSNKGERLEAVRVLTGRGRSTVWIALQLRITTRSVWRYRAELNTHRKAVA